MGLGPSLCKRCRVLHEYIPNEEPGKQGGWVCPINKWHAESTSLFFLPYEEWFEVFYETDLVSFHDKG